MGTEEKLNKFTDRITANSTALLLIAVVCYFFIQLFGFYFDGTDTWGTILGSTALTGENLFEIKGLGAIFAFLNAFLWAIVRLFAGLSFAAVCFDESKNIWFRVVSVAALMLIIFGGLRLF